MLCYYCHGQFMKSIHKGFTFPTCKHWICDECTKEICTFWSPKYKQMYSNKICKICEYEKENNLNLTFKERKIYHEYTKIRCRECVLVLPTDDKLNEELTNVQHEMSEIDNKLNQIYFNYGKLNVYREKLLERITEVENKKKH